MDGSVTLAWFVFSRRVLMLFPLLRVVLFLASPSLVSVGNEPSSYRRFILCALFRPPEGFFLCRFPCQTDIVGVSCWFLLVYEHEGGGLLNYLLLWCLV